MMQTTNNTLHLKLLLAIEDITELESTRDRLLEEFEDTLYELEREKEQNTLLKIENKKLSDMINEIRDAAIEMEDFFDEIKQGNEG